MHTSRFRTAGSASAGSYVTRIMLGLITSLSLMIALAHLPLRPPVERIGWQTHPPREELVLQNTPETEEGQASSEIPQTVYAPEETLPDDGEDETTGEEEEPASTLPEPAPSYKQTLKLAVLQFSQEMPKIIGGLGAYYINIEYPEEAKRAGIEGRLLLDFVVEPDGTPTDIHVLESLYPACDSAAVRALRATRFIPGRHNGDEVRVRMRLPVRFKLIDPNGETPAG